MERLEAKTIHGQTYYYYSSWGWTNGKCRRLWQTYLGKPQDIAAAVTTGGPAPLYAEVFAAGLPLALWHQAQYLHLVPTIEALCPKRHQGLSPGDYLTLAAINRACHPVSKLAFAKWFDQTALRRLYPHASAAALSSQRFWDHMDLIPPATTQAIWKQVLIDLIPREPLDLAAICYDGTNFYTFIDTFNVHTTLARRGKNKQGRGNLRQVSFALFCAADGPLPLYYEVYEGNRNDVTQFPLVVEKFQAFLKALAVQVPAALQTTLIFDKGNNSFDNISLLDALRLKFVGSVKLGELPELAAVSHRDARYVPCSEEEFPGTKAFVVQRSLYGQERTVVVTYNQQLFDAQWLTVQQDLAQATQQLGALQQRLQDREAGRIKGGHAPTAASVDKQCRELLSRPYLKDLLPYTVSLGQQGVPRLAYHLDSVALQTVLDTQLGKNLLITNQDTWVAERIIRAYRSQYLIEEVFKQMKDRQIGPWWPMHHWTDQKIYVHGLYCALAVLLRALLQRRARQQGLPLPMKRLLSELDGIREVVNVYPRKRGKRASATQTVWSKLSAIQEKLVAIFELNRAKTPI
jgi:transposase